MITPVLHNRTSLNRGISTEAKHISSINSKKLWLKWDFSPSLIVYLDRGMNHWIWILKLIINRSETMYANLPSIWWLSEKWILITEGTCAVSKHIDTALLRQWVRLKKWCVIPAWSSATCNCCRFDWHLDSLISLTDRGEGHYLLITSWCYIRLSWGVKMHLFLTYSNTS